MMLSATPLGAGWLQRFDNPAEREIAAALIDEILLVGRDDFVRELRSLIETMLAHEGGSQRPIALFAERKVRKANDEVLPYFPGTAQGRATGSGTAPIEGDQEIGSEGTVANLITDLARHHRGSFLSHPGPSSMRSQRVRQIVIVTDFIGSGKRVWEMLEAFRAVATLRSWHSYHRLSFGVVAYSGTRRGVRLVRSNRLQPKVTLVTACPTLWNSFRGVRRSEILALCERHPPKIPHPWGYADGGALIAFAHGMPNNAPPILHKSRRDWTPIFPLRSTSSAEFHFPRGGLEGDADRTARLLRLGDAYKHLADPHAGQWVATLVVLASLEAGARSAHDASARSGLPIKRVQEILSSARTASWTSESDVLTRLGRVELARLRRRRRKLPVLPTEESLFYYPTQLGDR